LLKGIHPSAISDGF